jgi:hypothetical protein
VAYQIQVIMPDGEMLSAPVKTAHTSGMVRWSFVQPPRTITRDSRRASVRLIVGDRTYEAHYSVAFDAIDVVAPHSPVAENSEIALWAHTQPRTRVTLQLSEPGSTTDRSLETGSGGWVSMHIRVQNASPPFQPVTVTFVATAVLSGTDRAARTDFQVLPFQFQVSLQNAQIFHQVTTAWAPTTSVRPGEELRVQAQSFITEPAGSMPLCASGYITIVQGSTRVQMAPIQCADGSSGAVIAELQLSRKLVAGSAQVGVDAFYENGSTHVDLPLIVVSG